MTRPRSKQMSSRKGNAGCPRPRPRSGDVRITDSAPACRALVGPGPSPRSTIPADRTSQRPDPLKTPEAQPPRDRARPRPNHAGGLTHYGDSHRGSRRRRRHLRPRATRAPGRGFPRAVRAPAGRGLPPPAPPPPPQGREEPAADADGMHPRPIEALKRKGALDGLLRRPVGTLNHSTASRPRPVCASARAEEASSNFPRVPPSLGTHGGAAAGAMGGATSMGGTGRGGRRRGRTGPTPSWRARAACDRTCGGRPRGSP